MIVPRVFRLLTAALTLAVAAVALTASLIATVPPTTRPSAADIAAAQAVLRQYLDDLKTDDSVAALIRQLGNDEYTVREAAQERLTAIGDKARPALEKAASDPDPEIASRVKTILTARTTPAQLMAQAQRVAQVCRAIAQLACDRDAKGWPLLLELLPQAPAGLREPAAQALAAYLPDRLPDLEAAWQAKRLSKDEAVLVLACLPDPAAAIKSDKAGAAVAALLPDVQALRKEMAARPAAWTSGKIDYHLFGGETQTVEVPALGRMKQPVIAVVYGLWGGSRGGRGNGSGAPPLTISVNGKVVGEISGPYDGYISPGPRIKAFDLSAAAGPGPLKVIIEAGVGGEAVVGEVKVWDKTGADPGVIQKFGTPDDKDVAPPPAEDIMP